MRDLGLIGFLLALVALGFRRPFLFVLAYAYVDIVSPQRLSYYLLNAIPVSLICFVLALGGWMLTDDKRGTRIAPRQWLMILLLAWVGYTTAHADLPIEAVTKWDWVWKALVFAIFLPLTLRTKLRIEALVLYMVLCAASIIVTGGIKTVLSGGGYGSLSLMVDSNSGLYEGSTISTVAIAIIPVILWLSRFGTIFPPDWRVRTFAFALIFACLLIPIGTETRTGLLCIVALGILMLRATKRRALYVALIGIAGLAAIPLLPSSFTSRMNTIEDYQADSSASTRLAVWGWTWDYVQQHPLGGGFEAYRQNRLTIKLSDVQESGSQATVSSSLQTDKGRAYHSAYFEMLGEQGFPGLILWLLLHISGLLGMEKLRRTYRDSAPEDAWIAPLATALQHGQIIYLVGALFVGIAFQPFIFMLIGVQIALTEHVRRGRQEQRRPFLTARRTATA
ncbi:MAG: putative O-glycosylation ligase, exosortase A system-associated [Sphingomonadaceae bacterium]